MRIPRRTSCAIGAVCVLVPLPGLAAFETKVALVLSKGPKPRRVALAAPPASARLAPGQILTGFGRGREDEASAVAIRQDGRIVVVGHSAGDVALARYLPNGALDRSFGKNGKVLTKGGYASALALQADGKAVVAGMSGHSFALLRYTRDGRLDRSFGNKGRVVSFVTKNWEAASDVAIQRDGKIVAAGSTTKSKGQVKRFLTARYLPNGALDRTFGTRGRAPSPDFGADEATGPDGKSFASDYVADVLIQPDGKIVVAGTGTECGMCDMSQFALARYTTTGKLDRAFGRDGTVHHMFGNDYAGLGGIALQPDGKIVAAGYWDDASGFALARYRANGGFDPTFGAAGRLRTSFGKVALAKDVALTRTGRIVAVGRIDRITDNSDFALACYKRGGGLDRSFGTGGKTLTSFAATGWDIAQAAAIQSDGKIVVVGSSGPADFAVARYEPNGKLDPTFGR